jgi:hypothetical protein
MPLIWSSSSAGSITGVSRRALERLERKTALWLLIVQALAPGFPVGLSRWVKLVAAASSGLSLGRSG